MNAPLEWQALWDAMEASPEAWIETTEAMYFEMLGVVPPRAHIGGSFLVGEALRSNGKGENIYSCFTRVGNSFKAKNLTLKEFKEGFK